MKKKLEKTLISIYKKKGYDGLASYLDSNVDWYIYDVLEGNTLDDKATMLVNKWKQEKKQTLSETKDMGWEPKVVLPKHFYNVTDLPPGYHNSSPFATSIDLMINPEKGTILKEIDGELTSETVDLYGDFECTDESTIKNGGVDYGIDTTNVNSTSVDDQKHKGLRYNEGKLRYDLVHPWSHEQMVKVLTAGSKKYKPRNWESGMSWSTVLASLERHLQAIKKGEDYDPETGELHAAHLACNAHFLTAYYKIYPQGDDRPHSYLSPLKVGLDIDDVLADFVGKWRERYVGRPINFWNFDKDMKDKFAEVAKDKEFWMSMKPKISPDELPFEPTCYITSRMIPNEWTEEWLQANGFPAVPVHTIGFNESKVAVAKESGIDIFVDDRYENFVELNNAGICTFLMDAPHNQRYQVGARRIFNLKELM